MVLFVQYNNWFNGRFSKKWYDKVDGYAGGYAGKTNYKYITYSKKYFEYWNTDYRKLSERNKISKLRKEYGFSGNGSYRYPIGSKNVQQKSYGTPK